MATHTVMSEESRTALRIATEQGMPTIDDIKLPNYDPAEDSGVSSPTPSHHCVAPVCTMHSDVRR